MQCYACQKELSKKELLFTEDRRSYCINPFTCGSPNHPNSPENILARNGAVKLYTEDQLEEIAFQNLDVPEETKQRIIKVATKPQSIRLSKVDIAHFLIQLQEKENFSSLSEAIRYCVLRTMDHEYERPQVKVIQPEPLKPNNRLPLPKPEPEYQPEPPMAKTEGLKVVIGEKPAIQKQKDPEPEPEETKEETEETFTF